MLIRYGDSRWSLKQFTDAHILFFERTEEYVLGREESHRLVILLDNQTGSALP